MPEGDSARWGWLRRLARGLGLAMVLTAGGGTGWHLGWWQERFTSSETVLTRLRVAAERGRAARAEQAAAPTLAEPMPSAASAVEMVETDVPSEQAAAPTVADPSEVQPAADIEKVLDPRDRAVIPPPAAAVAAALDDEDAAGSTFGAASRRPGAIVTYLVQPGDTLAALAERFGVDVQLIARLNGVAAGGLLEGGTLRIPMVEGVVHIVRAGETLSEIAEAYGVELSVIAASNQLEGDVIVPGERLLIPGGQPLPEATARPTPPRPTPTPAPSAPPLRRPAGSPPTASAATVQGAPLRSTPPPTATPQPARGAAGAAAPRTLPGGTLLWPVSGVITQRFGENGHLGLDIAAPTGTAVRAAAAGRVIVAAKLDYGYGWRIIIDHGGYTTLYAHLSAFSVAEGDRVARGQVIGAVGATGKATGPHLHFEVGIDGRPVDPQPYLP